MISTLTNKRIVVTGAAGFIGSQLADILCVEHLVDPLLLLDKFTYASEQTKLKGSITEFIPDKGNVRCVNILRNSIKVCDISQEESLNKTLSNFMPDVIFNLAAETHVDNSNTSPQEFYGTNVTGVFNILEYIRNYNPDCLLVQVSTDEVAGVTTPQQPLDYTSKVDPTSPYSATKAAAELLIESYCNVFGLNAVITRGCNTFGPGQHPEKLLPKTILSFLGSEPMKLYPPGTQKRQWIYVYDHAKAIINAAQTYLHYKITDELPTIKNNIGSSIYETNIYMMYFIRDLMRDKGFKVPDQPYVLEGDRPCHDTSYYIASSTLGGTQVYQPDNYTLCNHLDSLIAWVVENETELRKLL